MVSLPGLPGARARFCELKKSSPGPSQWMQTLAQRYLVRDGLITGELFPEIPSGVEDELTTLGKAQQK